MLYSPFLRKLETVATLSEDERRMAIALCRDVRTVARRRDVISEHEVPERVHVVLDGWAARYNILPNGSRRITAFLLPGDFCDIHVTTLAEMDHGIVAITDCKIAFIASERIDEITRSNPALTRALWRSTLIDESILRRWLVNSGRRDAEGSVCHLLCELYARLTLVGLVEDGTMDLPLTQEDLGDATGLTSVHVNRMVRSLRELGLIAPVSGRLHLPDVPALARHCQFDAQYLHLRTIEHVPV